MKKEKDFIEPEYDLGITTNKNILNSSGNSSTKTFNKQEFYEKEIKPLALQINQKCILNNIPVLLCTAVANTEKKTVYRYEGVVPSLLGLELTDDKFAKHICVSQGFNVVIPNVTDELSNIGDCLEDYSNEDAYIPLDNDD